LSCGSDKKIKLWNPVSGLLLKTYGGHADEVTDAAVTELIHICRYKWVFNIYFPYFREAVIAAILSPPV